jgi:large subunit ribosomal protein L15
MRPEMRDFIKKLPKLRGHGKNRARTVNNERVLATAINLNKIEAAFAAGDTVSPKSLVAHGLIETISKRVPKVKILATGEVTKKLTIEGCEVSAAALAKIEKAGGKVAK